ncbi:MAG: hypothetical protein HYR72_12900 [Deltaproteobacteria bacterium]|nr:hypothetical protein [Deltaproteobacteria bacterium]MBI3390455.1 hypothetical protein [Deltaproteobacteria bacterium]
MSDRSCELCECAPITRRYAEYQQPFRFVIMDCDSCDVPMAVLGEHRRAPHDTERAFMQAALGAIADAMFRHGWFFDDHMRQIPDHYHLHARPYPAWWPKTR